jgi:sugar phosphate isomerase/epimerase
MRRFSISQLTTSRWTFHQDVVRYLLHGFQSMGVWRQKIEDFDLLEITDYLHEMRMNVSSVHWAGGFTGGEGASHVDSIQDAIEAIELTSRLEGDCLIVHSGCQNGHISSHARRLFQQALQRLIPVAADYGVRLAVELMPCPSADNWTFMRGMECTLELINEFSEEQLGIVLDLYHVGLSGEVFEALPEFAHRIALVQLADRNQHGHCHQGRLMMGEGQVVFDKWLGSLIQNGYAGLYEIELHGAGVAATDYDLRLETASSFAEEIQNQWAINIAQQATLSRPPINRDR